MHYFLIRGVFLFLIYYVLISPFLFFAGYDAYATGCVFARQVEILQAQGIEGTRL